MNPKMEMPSPEMQRGIDECDRCRSICLATMTHCLRQGGGHAEPAHILTLLDCVDLCAAAANFMLRLSKMHPRICEVCAQACDACATSCEAFPDDEAMRSCAIECRRCAASCRLMVRMAAKASR
jgi:hypothetical protein